MALMAFITGLGPTLDGYTDGPMVTVRDFFAELVTTTGIRFMSAHWKDESSLLNLVAAINATNKTLLMGHSHGADRAIRIADGEYGPVNRIDCLIALDPKPPMGQNFLRWLFGSPYPPPWFADEVYCIRGSVGSKIKPGVNVHNYQLGPEYHGWFGHAKIPAAPDVLTLIGDKARELAA